jgi:putative chitinase
MVEYSMSLLPEDVSRYPAAILSAMWFWKEHRLNQFADMGDIDSITRDITGSLAEAENRKRRYIRVLQLLAISY